ncbi:hypothetical protein ACTFIZ_006729 [Dictyostelium cf. discoideum]
MSSNRNINYLRRSSRVPRIPLAAEAASDATTAANDVANVPPVTQRTATKSRDYDKEVFTSDDDSDRDTRVKKSKLNSIESKTIDSMKNAATAVIFMNIFNLYCTQYGVDPSLKTIMDNGAASYELIQLLQPTHNESVKNNDKIEGETLNKLIARNNKVGLNKINNGYIVFRKNKNLCLDCGYSNHQTEKCRVDPVNSKISQYHHLEDYDFSINKDSLYSLNSFYNQNISNELIKQTQQQDVHKNINKLKEYIKESYGIKLIPDTTVPIPESVKSEMKYKPKKIEFNTSTELPNVDDTNNIVNIFNPKRNNSDKKVINDDKDELLYTVKFDKETDKPIISLLHSTSSSDPILIPTHKCLIVPNKENMNKPRIIINSHTKEQQFKLILDTGSNVSLINKRLITNEMRNHVLKTKANINFPLLDVKEEFVEQINIQINNDIHTFFIIELDIIDVLFGNDILKDSIINQKDKLIKLNNSTYKITYQQSDQLECNVKAPRKHIPQVAKFVEDIPSQICDILVKSNRFEEEIQLLRDYINDSFEDVIVDKLPDIADQINNSKRGNKIHNIIIKKDQDVEPTKKQIYYSTDEHRIHVEEMVLKFID